MPALPELFRLLSFSHMRPSGPFAGVQILVKVKCVQLGTFLRLEYPVCDSASGASLPERFPQTHPLVLRSLFDKES